jgi:hypothetical protein
MFKKQFTTISIATLAALGALAMSTGGASAGGIKISFGHGHFGHGHWGHHRPHWGYYRPAYVSYPYVRTCHFVRRGGGLYKVCPVY